MPYKPKVGETMSEPNVIPMADIMLVLLIIFMVVTPMLQKGVTVDLARVTNPREMPDADKDDAVLISITRDGTVYLGTKKVTLDELTSQVRDRDSSRLDKTVYIKSDYRAKYGDVVKVVDQLGLITERLNRPTPPPPPQTGG